MLKKTKWLEKMLREYNKGVSNAFIVIGEIKDYAIKDYLIKDYLPTQLLDILGLDDIFFFNLNSVKSFKGNSTEEYSSLKNLVSLLTDKDSGKKYGVIITYPEFIFPTDEMRLYDNEKKDLILLEDLLNDSRFCTSDHVLVMMSESHGNINKRFLGNNSKTEVITIPLPDEHERREFIVSKNILGRIKRCLVTPNELAKATAGLSLLNIEDILLNAIYSDELTIEMALTRKKELIQREYQDIIEIMESDGLSLSNFAGHDLVKDYIKEAIVVPIKEGNLSIVPKGVLLTGPPGTGKTYFTKCLAGDAGINFVEFKMSKILDKYVGEAEKNLERAMGVFRALAPVGVFIDEVEQALSRGDNDSNSVSKNLFGMFLAEMSKPDNRGKIIWFGATNYPDKLDEAFKRAGRFDKKIPFFAPDEHDRERVFSIHLKKANLKVSDDIDYAKLAEKTDGYTQAEIENIVVKALELCNRKKEKCITQEMVELALKYMKHAENGRIREMEDLAIDECNDLEFLPEKYLQRKR